MHITLFATNCFFTFRVLPFSFILWSHVSAPEFWVHAMISNGKKDWCDIIHILQLLTMLLLNLSIQFLASRDKFLSIDHYVTESPYRKPYFTFQPAEWARSTEHKLFASASKGLTLEDLTTFMDCCLRTRDRNVVDYPGVIGWMSLRRWCALPTSTRRSSYPLPSRILNTPLLNIWT